MSTPAEREDPLAAWRPSPWVFALGAAAIASVLLYPLVIERALAIWGVRAVSIALIGVALASLAVPTRGGESRIDRFVPWPRVPGVRAAFLALLVLAALFAERRYLLLLPAGIQLYLALAFGLSLREPVSVMEGAARFLQPRAPDFIRPYCRGLTALWSALFLAFALVIGVLALRGDVEWRSVTGSGIWVAMGVVTAIEYVVRKLTFRYYENTLIDRLWSACFPAERTARGRRSLAYIEESKARMRAEGLVPPGEEP